MKSAERKTKIKNPIRNLPLNAVKKSLARIIETDEKISALEARRNIESNYLRNFLRDVRRENGLSSQEVADAVGVTQGYYADMERGRRSLTPITVSKLLELVSEMK